MASGPDARLTGGVLSTTAITGDATSPVPAADDPHRFAPGAIIVGRYRVVALLGRGGMGEVYRADDLTLDQPVALKFLPGLVTAADTRLAQFHNELKTARQVSHKNVCRLYDLGEAHGRRFLTMEYVDGEDLGSLLRRIGRLPHDKAVDIARQLCAGVAAAHDRGVVHRDLKPSNIMVDAEGNVRITDFGIATAAGGASSGSAGTPQYMAPELFTGAAASVQSDIYALGLILFEVFTGRRAVEAPTVAALREFHARGTITTPSSIVHDVDPAVERLILRCLEREPAHRPVSALVIAAGLPGADPLAAALAAGETPSPELLAAAGETSAVGVAPGLTMALATIIGMIVFTTVSANISFVGRTPLGRSPAVLVDRAQQILASLGYADTPGDTESGFSLNDALLNWIRNRRATPDRWDSLGTGVPPAVLFWYRTSRQALRPLVGMAVEMDDPPLSANMRLVVLDPAGRLLQFRAVPPLRDVAGTTTPDWAALFAAAGLDRTAFAPSGTQWIPREFGDVRQAWDGPLGAGTDVQVHVEAAALHGRAVWFAVYGPWNQPPGPGPAAPSVGMILDRLALTVMLLALVAILGAAVMLARRNLRQNRADRRSAIRIAATVAALSAAGWLLAAHHVSSVPVELQGVVRMAEQVMLVAVVIWVLYVGLEPYIRRFWPDSLLGWTRLTTGHFRDPRCGRDLLVGFTTGVVITLVELAKVTVPALLGGVAPYPTMGDRPRFLGGSAAVVNSWLSSASSGIEFALLAGMAVVMLRLAVRWPWLRAVVIACLLSILCTDNMGSNYLLLVSPLIAGALLAWVLLRHGLLALAAAWFIRLVLMTVPFAPSGSGWSAAAGNWTLLMLILLTVFAFSAARAGQPLFGRILQD